MVSIEQLKKMVDELDGQAMLFVDILDDNERTLIADVKARLDMEEPIPMSYAQQVEKIYGKVKSILHDALGV